MFQKIGLKFLHGIDAESAHSIALLYLKLKLFHSKQEIRYPKLQTRVAGIILPNPLGLAAGFDKNAVAIKPISNLGFGFLEVGAVTPEPQPGNPKPRVFRIKSEKAIVNHYGFNNEGMLKINHRLKKFKKKSILGLNIGANKNSLNMASDFTKVLQHCAENVHFASINISSPNTNDLRNFQQKDKLNDLLSLITEAKQNLSNPIPIFIKISPDLEFNELENIVDLAHQHNLAGIIATNTSTDYQILKNPRNFLKGGVSGGPLLTKSTQVLAKLSIISEGQIPLIGVGGIFSGKDAFEKICAGASAVQLYSALTFYGPDLVYSILTDLNKILEDSGYNNISDVVGIKKYDYAGHF